MLNLMKAGQKFIGQGAGGGQGKYSDTTDLWKNGMEGYQDMSTTPQGLMDSSGFSNPEKEGAMFTGEGLSIGGYQDRTPAQKEAAGEEADGLFGWMKKKYPEMAEMGTAEQLAFLKSKGAIGSGVYHGADQANQLGQSQAQSANMMGDMGSLMKQTMGAGLTPNKKQIEIGLMGGGRSQNPWGLMGG